MAEQEPKRNVLEEIAVCCDKIYLKSVLTKEARKNNLDKQRQYKAFKRSGCVKCDGYNDKSCEGYRPFE
nr:hypothetical protein [Nanoarchaeota archaeon]